MLESILYAIIAIATGMLGLAIFTRVPAWAILSGATFMLLGILLFSGVGLTGQDVVIATLNSGGTYDINTITGTEYTVTNDDGLNLMANLLLYGGFAVIMMSMWILSRMNKDDLDRGIGNEQDEE